MGSFVIHLIYIYLGSSVGVGYRLMNCDTEAVVQAFTRNRDLSFLRRVQTIFGNYQTSYSKDTMRSFPGGEMAGGRD